MQRDEGRKTFVFRDDILLPSIEIMDEFILSMNVAFALDHRNVFIQLLIKLIKNAKRLDQREQSLCNYTF